MDRNVIYLFFFFLGEGCGNGKYLGINPSIAKIGCDSSVKLVEICNERGFEAFVSDTTNLPFRSNSCDIVLSIGKQLLNKTCFTTCFS